MKDLDYWNEIRWRRLVLIPKWIKRFPALEGQTTTLPLYRESSGERMEIANPFSWFQCRRRLLSKEFFQGATQSFKKAAARCRANPAASCDLLTIQLPVKSWPLRLQALDKKSAATLADLLAKCYRAFKFDEFSGAFQSSVGRLNKSGWTSCFLSYFLRCILSWQQLTKLDLKFNFKSCLQSAWVIPIGYSKRCTPHVNSCRLQLAVKRFYWRASVAVDRTP